MAFSTYMTIETDEIARQMSNDPQDTLDVLANLAIGFDDVGDAEHFAEEVASHCSGSVAHLAVGRFLRLLAEKLEGF